MAEKQRRTAVGEVQYLTEAQLQQIVEQNPGSDIRDYEDLQTGTVDLTIEHSSQQTHNIYFRESLSTQMLHCFT